MGLNPRTKKLLQTRARGGKDIEEETKGGHGGRMKKRLGGRKMFGRQANREGRNDDN